MSDILDTHLGMPPGLWPMLPEEDTERFRREGFRRNNLSDDEMLELGLFVASIAFFDGERPSFMPTKGDFSALCRDGFGMPPSRFHSNEATLSDINRKLGFYPYGTVVEKSEMLKRYEWIHEYALPKDPSVNLEDMTVIDVILWASRRNLGPGLSSVEKTLNSGLGEISDIFKTGQNRINGMTYRAIFEFGRKIIVENNGPLLQSEVQEKYGGDLPTTFSYIVASRVGGQSKFWAELGHGAGVPSVLNRESVLDVSTRHQLERGPVRFTRGYIQGESSAGNLFSARAVKDYFESAEDFRRASSDRFADVTALRDKYLRDGVTEEIFYLMSRDFTYDQDYFQKLEGRRRVMQLLSQENSSEEIECLVEFLKNGPNLEKDFIYDEQIRSMFGYLRRNKIRDYDSTVAYLDCVPCLDPDEAIKDAGLFVVQDKTTNNEKRLRWPHDARGK